MSLIDLNIYEYTSPCPEFVLVNDSVIKVKEKMKKYGIRHIPVLDNCNIVGMISQRDLGLKFISANAIDLLAVDVMANNPYIVHMNTPLEEVVFNMSKNKIGSAIVKDVNDDLVGIFTNTDALNALIDILRGQVDPEQIK